VYQGPRFFRPDESARRGSDGQVLLLAEPLSEPAWEAGRVIEPTEKFQ
jgi:hypothetical protein